MLRAVARFAGRYRWFVALAWLSVFVCGVMFGSSVFGKLTTESGESTLDSVRGQRLLTSTAPYGPTVLAVIDDVDARSAGTRTAVLAAARDLDAHRLVNAVHTPYDSGPDAAALIAQDRRAVLVTIRLTKGLSASEQNEAADLAQERLAAVPGGRVVLGGDSVLRREANDQVREDLTSGEAVSLPLAALVLVLVFGGVVAAGLPLAAALVSVAGAMLVLLGLADVVNLSPDVPNVVTVLGVGLSIDYGLLIVSRFREEAARMGPREPDRIATTLGRTLDTAGRTVTFSALTVMVSLSGLLVFHSQTYQSIAVAGMAVVFLALAAALTLMPALLAICSRRLLSRPGRHTLPARRWAGGLAAPPGPDGVFARLARGVQRRPVLTTVLVVGLLAILTLPFLGVRYKQNETDALPASFGGRQVADLLATRFPGGDVDPILIVAKATPADPRITGLVGEVNGWADVSDVSVRTDPPPGLTVVAVVPVGDPQGDAAQRVVGSLRQLQPGFTFHVTGRVALLVDLRHQLAAGLPWAGAVIISSTVVLLFLLTGSLLVPLKALIMNVLSLGASFGALVWVFQDGHLAGLIGFTPTGAIEQWVPVIVFVFAFGLSMDYEVFLLSRIKELHDSGLDSNAAVAGGLQRSGRIVTSAALLIVIVFVGFTTGQMLGIKQLGLALTIAVVIDATLVRCLLVPATMTLLGDLNWWAPAPLRRLHDRFGLRESGTAPEPLREVFDRGLARPALDTSHLGS